MCLYVCVCACVRVYGLCVYLVWCSSHLHPPHTHRRTPTPITKTTVIHPPTHTETHTHPCTNTHIPSMKANSPRCTRPTPTHCPLTHPHTYLDSGCAKVRCLGRGGFCVCVCVYVCLPVGVDVFLRMCVCVGGWVVVSMCSRVSGCVCLCQCACWCEVQEGCVCMCVCVCVCACVWLVRISGFALLTSSPAPHTQAHAHTHNKKDSYTPPPHTETHTHPCTNTHIPSMKANSPPLDPYRHTLPAQTPSYVPGQWMCHG